MKKIATTLLLVLALSACTGNAAESAANEYCKCAKPMFEQGEKMQQAMQSGDMSQMQSMMGSMQSMAAELQTCMTDLQTKYADKENDDDFKNQVMAHIEKQCPNPMQRMGMQR